MKNRSIVVGIFVVLLSAVSLACSKTPVFSQAGIDKIREYNKAGDRDRAIAAAQKYLSANPNDSEVLTILGENYGWKKNFASAEKSLKKAIRIQPKNTWAIRALTAIYRNQAQEAESPKSKAGYLALAVARIGEGLSIAPNDPWVNMEAAEVYLLAGDRHKAQEYIAKALKVEPAPANAYVRSLEKRILAMP